jgi:uncharacterized protein YyaL (SSP411 family)
VKQLLDQEDENTRIRRLREMDKSDLPPDGGPDFNRLIFAGSPYLLQHAENPVDWHPWSDEAFAKARSEDKAVFLSIGYATCHWCHVMAHESFEDEEVADVLNRHFVPIKVDREERPDIDEQYMTAAHLMNVGGGWPLTVFMSPDRRPFFIATYLPRTRHQGTGGIIDILEEIAEAWKTRREEIERHGAAVIAAMARLTSPTEMEIPNGGLLPEAYQRLGETFDKKWGGFGTAPKFPMPLYLSFLLRYARRTGSGEALGMAEQTLQTMRRGGIYDQIGFGFHRYSVDRHWLVPHFEKMLYDQALLAMAYLDAFQAGGNKFFREVAQEIFQYVKREMTASEGGFYSALDADSEGSEGTYYLWTPLEVKAVLGPDASRRIFALWGITDQGNFEGKNILYLPLVMEEFAAKERITIENLIVEVNRQRQMLQEAREKRVKPLRDEKIMTAWNGLMIAALARGYAAGGDDDYRRAASRAVSYIRERMTDSTGRILRIRHANSDGILGFLEDYAFFCWGLIELYQATLEPVYLASALGYTKDMLRLFGDPESGGLFESGLDSEKALIRTRGATDGVTPSGNSVAAMNLVRLGKITGDAALLDAGEKIIRSWMGNVTRQPAGYVALLSALDYLDGSSVEITLAFGRRGQDPSAMLNAIGRRFLPGLVLRRVDESSKFPAVDDRTTAYVCAAGACRPPIVKLAELESLLDEIVDIGAEQH